MSEYYTNCYDLKMQEREELRSQADHDRKMILEQVDSNCNDVMAGKP